MMATFECGKCSGKGYIDAFRHIANGSCFLCGGTGKVSIRGPIKPFSVPAPPTAADFVAEDRRPTLKQIALLDRLSAEVARKNNHCSCGTLQAWFHKQGNHWTSPAGMDWMCVDRALASKVIDIAKAELAALERSSAA